MARVFHAASSGSDDDYADSDDADSDDGKAELLDDSHHSYGDVGEVELSGGNGEPEDAGGAFLSILNFHFSVLPIDVGSPPPSCVLFHIASSRLWSFPVSVACTSFRGHS